MKLANMKWVLRAAAFTDTPIFARIFSSHLEQLVPDATSPARAHLLALHTEQRFVERLQQGWFAIVAEQRGHVDGFLMLRPPAHLFSLYVAKTRTGNGIGTALLQALFAQQPQEITVNSSVGAEAFYRRHSFVPTDAWQFSDGLRYLPMRRPVS